jgi:uncharacterized membrane protein YcaP (DUF421 family)
VTEPIFFDGWAHVLRALVLAATAYVGLLVMLRAVGKRAVAKMNIFDFIFVVALGSTLSSTILGSGNTLAEGLTAVAGLLAVHYLFTLLALRSRRMESIINGEPALLARDGRLLRDAMRRERITEEEVLGSIRSHGIGGVEDVVAVVLETDGTFSVVARKDSGTSSSLSDVKFPGEEGYRDAGLGGDAPRG